MKRFLVLAGLLALTAPAAYAAPPAGTGKPEASASSNSGQGSAALCREQRRTMGMSAFRALYAPTGNPKAAFDACLAKLSVQASANAKNAAQECKALRAQDPEAFKTHWGTNANKANAFGKCVSSKAKESTQEQQDATLNAAKTCKAERALDPAAFKTKWGTNANKANAFGKCVSATAKKQGESGDD
jgi:hypothetical protein